MVGGKKEEMLAVRKKTGPAVSGVLTRIKFGEARWSAPGSADLPQDIAVIGLINDDVVLIPGAASRVRSIRDNGNRSAGRGHLFQVAVGKKSDEPAIVGPEGKGGAFGAVEFRGSDVVEELHPERVSFFFSAGAEGDCAAVQADGRGAGKIAGELESGVRGWRKKRANGLGGSRALLAKGGP